MCCAGISFANLNIKVLGPRIDGSAVNDFADLIDGDGDGKCKERGGNFIPCPPKKIVQAFQNYQARVNRLRELTPASGDPVGNHYISQVLSEVQGAIDINIGHLRGNRPNWVDDQRLQRLLEEAEEWLKGKPEAPAKQNTEQARLARAKRYENLVERMRGLIRGGLGNDDLRAAQEAHDRYAADNNNENLDKFERVVTRLENGQPAGQASSAQRASGRKPQGEQQNNRANILERRDAAETRAADLFNARDISDDDRYQYRRRFKNIARLIDNALNDGDEKLANELMDLFEELLDGINQDYPNPRRDNVASPDYEPAENLDEIVQEQRNKRKAKAKKIRESAKKFVSPAIRNYFERNNVNNMDEWLTGDEQEKSQKLAKWASRIFDVTFEDKDGNKYRVNLQGVDAYPQSGYARVSGEIVDSDGNQVATFTRTLFFKGNPEGAIPHVYHSIFQVNRENQKGGIGSTFIAATELAYVAAGFDHIKVSGSSQSGWNGATQWPKNGFDWANETAKNQVIAMVQRAVNSDRVRFESEQQRANIRALLERARNESLDTPDRVTAADLLEFPGAEKHFQEVGALIGYKRKLQD